jgi:hypothetical protein
MNDSSKIRKGIILWVSGAALLTGCMVLCAYWYKDENVMSVFVILASVCGLLAFLNKWVGFLFLPVLIGSFFFMGTYASWYWESKGMDYYEDVDIKDIYTADSFPALPRFHFPVSIHPETRDFSHRAEYDQMTIENPDRGGMRLAEHYYFFLKKTPADPDSLSRFILKIEENDETPSFQEQVEAIQNGQSLTAVKVHTQLADTLFFLEELENENFLSRGDIILIRWGDPADEVARLWKKLIWTFFYAHLGWLVLLAIHLYDPAPKGE